MTHLFLKHLNS